MPASPWKSSNFRKTAKPVEVVLATAAHADAFCHWLRAGGIKAGFLTEDHEVQPLRDLAFDNPDLSERARRDDLRPFRVRIRQIVYGRLQITSNPPGADVYVNGPPGGFHLRPRC